MSGFCVKMDIQYYPPIRVLVTTFDYYFKNFVTNALIMIL